MLEAEKGQLMRRATYASVMVAFVLIILKIFAYLLTHSVAVLSSLIDSLLDLFVSVINAFAVKHALVPADDEHRYGHGKAEAVAGLVQVAFISGSAIFLIFEAVSRFFNAQAVEHSMVGIAVMIVSIVLTALLVRFQHYVVKQTGSVAITADSLHYVGDLCFNLGIIIALLCSTYLDWQFVDPVFALVVVVFILRSAYMVGKQSLAQLMDQELSDDLRGQIRDIALAHPDVVNLHELRTRAAGRQYFIQLHLEMDGDLNLRAAHRIAHEVEADICRVFPNAEIIIHQDMAGVDEPLERS